MSSTGAQLVPIHIGPEKQINIFIHGLFDHSDGEWHEHILATRPIGRVYSLSWSGDYLTGPAETIGNMLMRQISHIPHAKDYPINLIGHSMGARVIHHALASYYWYKSDYCINDCILLGGAADGEAGHDDDGDPESWENCANEIHGKIYNAYSPTDGWLMLARTVGMSPCGLIGIRWSYPGKIVNRKYRFDHEDYWNNLEYILRRLWPDFRQSKACVVCCGSGNKECPNSKCDDDGEVPCECEGDDDDCKYCCGDGFALCGEDCDEGWVQCTNCVGTGYDPGSLPDSWKQQALKAQGSRNMTATPDDLRTAIEQHLKKTFDLTEGEITIKGDDPERKNPLTLRVDAMVAASMKALENADQGQGWRVVTTMKGEPMIRPLADSEPWTSDDFIHDLGLDHFLKAQ